MGRWAGRSLCQTRQQLQICYIMLRISRICQSFLCLRKPYPASHCNELYFERRYICKKCLYTICKFCIRSRIRRCCSWYLAFSLVHWKVLWSFSEKCRYTFLRININPKKIIIFFFVSAWSNSSFAGSVEGFTNPE